MDNFKSFLSWTYPQEVLMERQQVIEDLVRYVVRGCESPYGRQENHPQEQPFTDRVRSMMLSECQPRLVTKRKMKVNCGDTTKLVLEAFRTAIKNTRMTSICTPHFSNAALCEAFGNEFGVAVVPLVNEAPPTVVGAYHQALADLYQAETRLVALAAINELLMSPYYADRLTGYGELRDTLYQRRDRVLLNVATFGCLLGPESAATVARILAEKRCHAPDEGALQYSIIEYLQPDCRVPGSYLTSTVGAFRIDIKRYYDRLATTPTR